MDKGGYEIENWLHSASKISGQSVENIDCLAKPVFIISSEKKIIFANQKAGDLLRISADECRGLPCPLDCRGACFTEGCALGGAAGGGAAARLTRGHKIYQARLLRFCDRDGKALGYAVVLDDAEISRRSPESPLLTADDIPVGIFKIKLDDGLTILYGNEFYYQVCGYTKQQVRRELFNHAAGLIHPSDLIRARRLIKAALEAQKPSLRMEMRIVKRDESIAWILWEGTFSTVAEGTIMSGVMLDVTEQKIEEMRHMSEEQYLAAIAMEAAAVYEVNITRDQVMKSNETLRPRAGCEAPCRFSEAVRRIAAELVVPGDREKLLKMYDRASLLAAYREGRTELRLEYRRQAPQGGVIWVTVVMRLIKEPVRGDICGFIYIKDIHAQKMQELQSKERRDALTGLYHKAALREMIEAALRQDDGPAGALLLIGFDDFLGCQASEQALVEFAQNLQRTFAEGAIVGRAGAGEFMVFLNRISSAEFVCAQAEDICRLPYHDADGRSGRISVSAGVTFFSGRASFKELYEQAKIALYRAKDLSGGRYCVYETGYVRSNYAKCMNKQWLLDALDEMIYVSDMETYEIFYMNYQGRKNMVAGGEDYIGRKCYEVVQGRGEPCPFCLRNLLKQDKFFIWEQTNTHLQRHFIMKEKLVQWDSQLAHMTVMIDITEKENVSQALSAKLEIETTLVKCIRSLMGTQSLDEAVHLVLACIGDFFQADRAYILEDDLEAGVSSNTYEWCREGVAPQIHYLKNIPSGVMGKKRAERDGAPIVVEDIEDIRFSNPNEYQFLKLQNISSFMMVPFQVEDLLSGYIAVDNPTLHKRMVSLLSSLVYFITSEISKRRLHEKMNYMSYHDLLTGLYNRNRYTEYLDHIDVENLSSLGIIVADINGLKRLNESYGHSYGDQMVVTVADILKKYFSFQSIFRLGGDEFTVLCANMGRTEFIKIVQTIKPEFEKVENGGISFGYAWSNMDIEVQSLINHAEELMFIEKQKYYQNAETIGKHHQPHRIRKLQEIIDAGEFVLFLQPKASLQTGEIIGAEALVRLIHPPRGIIPPSKFIPTLEKDHLIRYVDFFVYEEVLKMLSAWKDQGRPLMPVSLNFSRVTLLEPDLKEVLRSIHAKYDIDREWIEIEITESFGEMEHETIAEIGKNIKELGFGIALDDFGAKYTSMSMLSIVHFDVLKLDRSLVNHVVYNASSRTIVRHVIEMCREMKVRSVAEGIETEEQLAMLKDLGCDFAQGYYFSRPLPVREFEIKYLGRGEPGDGPE